MQELRKQCNLKTFGSGVSDQSARQVYQYKAQFIAKRLVHEHRLEMCFTQSVFGHPDRLEPTRRRESSSKTFKFNFRLSSTTIHRHPLPHHTRGRFLVDSPSSCSFFPLPHRSSPSTSLDLVLSFYLSPTILSSSPVPHVPFTPGPQSDAITRIPPPPPRRRGFQSLQY